MLDQLPSRPGWRFALVGAALTTVAVAVGADVAAGERPLHTFALGLVAVVVAGLRVRLAGRHSGVFAAVSGAVVAQPALHATAKLLHPVDDHHGLAHAAQADVSITVFHVLVAAAVIAMVTSSEQLLLLMASTLTRARRGLRLLRAAAPSHPPAPVCTVEMRPPPPSREWVGYLTRRGPPTPSPRHP